MQLHSGMSMKPILAITIYKNCSTGSNYHWLIVEWIPKAIKVHRTSEGVIWLLFNLALANCIVPENTHTSPKKVVLVWTLPHHFQFWFTLSFKYFVFRDLSPSELLTILLWVSMDIFWNQTFCSWNTPSTVDSQKGKAWKCGLNACNLDDWSGCVKFNVSYSRSPTILLMC